MLLWPPDATGVGANFPASMDQIPKAAPPISVFVICDYPLLRWGLERLIGTGAPALELVGSAADCAYALDCLAALSPDVLLIDLDMGVELVVDAIPDLLARSGGKILLLTRGGDSSAQDKAVLAGARGVVDRDAPADLLLKALAKVHHGQMWLDREATGRIFVKLSRRSAAKAADPERQRIESLTDREQAIIACIAENSGNTGKVIAEKLHISESTLRNHLTSIYEKLGVANRHGLLAYAFKHGLAKSVA